MSVIFDPTMRFLAAGLDVTLYRQNVIMGNVANLDTPNYAPKDINFADALNEAIEAQQPRASATAEPANFAQHTEERPDREAGPSGNSVELDIQMGRLAQNSTLYGASSRAISRKLALMRDIINDGGH